MAKEITLESKELIHRHYIYSCKFNNVGLSKHDVTCNKRLFYKQKERNFDLIEEGMYLCHYGESCCILTDTVGGAKEQAMHARTAQ